jgi:hypothetical protein
MPPRLRTERSAPEVGRRFPLAAAQIQVLGMPGHNSPGLWRWPGGVRARRRLMRMITDQESRVSLWVGSVRSAGRCGGAGDPGTTSLDYGPSVHRRYIRSGGFDSNSLKRPVTKQVTTPPGNDRFDKRRTRTPISPRPAAIRPSSTLSDETGIYGRGEVYGTVSQMPS